ncbi:MAG: excinuclease ABC subunit UvrC [Verrucomicrobia bacterium]|nr:excinuclease ABC subunit UvrC [Verrucomicrobiota bacterium]
MKFDPKLLEQYPTQPGVYLMKNAEGQVIYVGKAKQLKVRLKQYFAPSGDTRAMIPFLIQQIAHIDTIVVPSEKEALLLENTLIKKHQPKFNAILKDDKTFISLMINHRHQWPMLRLIRSKGPPTEDALYFGPYTSAYAARQTYELLTRIFPLRQCSDEELKRRSRPCLLYDIKRCIAPCVSKCTQQEYDALVFGAIRFLRGQDKEILIELKNQMEQAAEALEYEKAAMLLQRIRQIEHVLETQSLVVKAEGKNTDVIALYREGEEVMLIQLLFREGKLIGSEHYAFSEILEEDEELLSSFLLQHYHGQENHPQEILLPSPLKDAPLLSEILNIAIHTPQKGPKRALVEIALENALATFNQEKDEQELKEKMLLDLEETLRLTRYPKRIECFDTSHLQGSDPVASLVAFTNGEKDSKRMRLFRVKTTTQGDDYGAMREVLRRHLTKAKAADDLPDLIIIDGGKGQLSSALEIFKELDIASVDLIALTKEEGRHDKGMTAERVFLPGNHDPIRLSKRSSLLFLLQKIRDEAHNQAIRFHRKRRSKRTLSSSIEAIRGIGPTKRGRLLRHFGSVARLKEATPEQLAEVKGITKKDIKAIKDHFS